MLRQCKRSSREKQAKRRLDEGYLGKVPFSVEIIRSFNEFLTEVVKSFGFLPYDVRYWQQSRDI